MTEWQKYREALKQQHCSTKYFNKAFLEAYKNARAKAKFNFKHGIDDSYKDPKHEWVTLYHSYDEIYGSKFYQENSGTYCAFLELAHANGI